MGLAFWLDPTVEGADVCWFHLYSGLPCPGCGLSRGCEWLARGQPGKAWELNPLAFLALPGMALGSLACLARACGWQPGPPLARALRAAAWVGVALLLAFWTLRLLEALLTPTPNSP